MAENTKDSPEQIEKDREFLHEFGEKPTRTYEYVVGKPPFQSTRSTTLELRTLHPELYTDLAQRGIHLAKLFDALNRPGLKKLSRENFDLLNRSNLLFSGLAHRPEKQHTPEFADDLRQLDKNIVRLQNALNELENARKKAQEQLVNPAAAGTLTPPVSTFNPPVAEAPPSAEAEPTRTSPTPEPPTPAPAEPARFVRPGQHFIREKPPTPVQPEKTVLNSLGSFLDRMNALKNDLSDLTPEQATGVRAAVDAVKEQIRNSGDNFVTAALYFFERDNANQVSESAIMRLLSELDVLQDTNAVSKGDPRLAQLQQSTQTKIRVYYDAHSLTNQSRRDAVRRRDQPWKDDFVYMMSEAVDVGSVGFNSNRHLLDRLGAELGISSRSPLSSVLSEIAKTFTDTTENNRSSTALDNANIPPEEVTFKRDFQEIFFQTNIHGVVLHYNFNTKQFSMLWNAQALNPIIREAITNKAVPAAKEV